jgi:allophanate hydrolase subunit 2
MGYRLDGNAIEHKEGKKEIISDGTPLGAVQVPGDGKPIVLMKDRQTTGGYPKIATVITTDIIDIAQMKTNDSLRFEAVTLEKAHSILVEYKRMLENIRASLSAKRYKMIINGKEHYIGVEEL